MSEDSGGIAVTPLMTAVDKILNSDTFRNSEALRRLLRYLADKTESGEGDQLKEYAIGIDVLGKPPSYDPRSDSTVRIQGGRLRRKLEDYYRSEGKNDPVVLLLPKGGYKLTTREAAAAEVDQGFPKPEVGLPNPASSSNGLRIALAVAITIAGIALFLLIREKEHSVASPFVWSSELEEVWSPFLTPERPLIISVLDPIFVEFKGVGVYRDSNATSADWTKGPRVASLRKLFGNAETQEINNWGPAAQADISFLLGRSLGSRMKWVSVLGFSKVNVQALAANNVILTGAQAVFETRLRSTPVELELRSVRGGIEDLNPRQGAPTLYEDHPATVADGPGEVFVLVTRVPGPQRVGLLQSFSSTVSVGQVGAVAWFTSTDSAPTIVGKLRNSAGKIPIYFQMLLRVKYRAGVPTETSYVLHRELTLPAR